MPKKKATPKKETTPKKEATSMKESLEKDNFWACEELRVLSAIIARTETSVYQRQGWLLTLWLSLAVAAFKNDPLIDAWTYFYISIVTIILFLFLPRLPSGFLIQRQSPGQNNRKVDTRWRRI